MGDTGFWDIIERFKSLVPARDVWVYSIDAMVEELNAATGPLSSRIHITVHMKSRMTIIRSIASLIVRYNFTDDPDECEAQNANIHMVGLVAPWVDSGYGGYANYWQNVSWVNMDYYDYMVPFSSPWGGPTLAQEVSLNYSGLIGELWRRQLWRPRWNQRRVSLSAMPDRSQLQRDDLLGIRPDYRQADRARPCRPRTTPCGAGLHVLRRLPWVSDYTWTRFRAEGRSLCDGRRGTWSRWPTATARRVRRYRGRNVERATTVVADGLLVVGAINKTNLRSSRIHSAYKVAPGILPREVAQAQLVRAVAAVTSGR